MPDLYTAIVFITVFTLTINAADVMSNKLVSQKNKREIIAVCIFMGIALMGEWIGVKTNGADPSLIWLHKAAKLVEFCAAPAIGIAAAIAYGKVKSVRAAYAFTVGHAIFEIIALANGWVFSIDSNNVYHRESLYWLYILSFIITVLYCFACMVIGYRRYQARFNIVMALVLCLIASGVVIQIIDSDMRIDFMCAAIGNIFLYANRASVVNQVDKTTRLLNRRCFERSVENINSKVCVIVFDVNKFKVINDTYGHTVGDECLKDVANIINAVYGKYGYCYRIGGDEFCVILHKKNIDKLENLNNRLHSETLRFRSRYGNLFGISLGYSFCDGKETTVADALKRADEMMYENKRK